MLSNGWFICIGLAFGHIFLSAYCTYMKGLRALMERSGGRQLRELHGGLEVSEYVRGLQLRRGGSSGSCMEDWR